MHSFGKYINPHLGDLLPKINLDKTFTRGEGCYLYDSEGNKYLDCIANYGAVPLGYNHPALWKAVNKLRDQKEPNLVKPSFMEAAGTLAERLIELMPSGLNYVTFTNSGAEAVEAAIKQCRASTGRHGILSTWNSFHGKTLGALSATGNPHYQKPFLDPESRKNFQYIEFGNTQKLEAKLAQNPDFFAGFILEPIQGEGGIITPPENYLREVKEICQSYKVPLILDEIQTGLGRTGNLLASELYDVQPDIILLAKALGGGMMPLGACISSEEIYSSEFAQKHSSTFSGSSLACRVGLKVLELLTENNCELISKVEHHGKFLKKQLQKLADNFPALIKEVRGKGYMLGLEFNLTRDDFPGSLLGIMTEQELFSPLAASFLLNREKIRVAPTLNGNNTLRIEPPLIFDKQQCRITADKIENMLSVLQQGNTARFVSHLVNCEIKEIEPAANHSSPEKKAPLLTHKKGESKFAFLIHPLDLQNYYEYDKSLQAFSDKQLRELTDKWKNMLGPFVASRTKITSPAGQKAYGEFIALPHTTEDFLEMPRKKSIKEVKKALGLAEKRGAKIVGLGAYTAVVTRAGLYVKKEDIPVTTGNSYTVVAAVQAVSRALSQLNIKAENSTAAIVGAAGSIGGGAAQLVARSFARLILIGNPEHKDSSIKRLTEKAADIYQHLSELIESNHQFKPGSLGYRLKNEPRLPDARADRAKFIKFAEQDEAPITITTKIENFLPEADVTICATNSIEELITPANVKKGAVICDISRPKNVSPEINEKRPDVLVIDGGIISVPGRPSMGWDFGFEQGLVYACMAETMMLALEKKYENMSLGSSGVNLNSILMTRHLAQKHGFEVAQLRSFDRPLKEEKWEQVARSRKNYRVSS